MSQDFIDPVFWQPLNLVSRKRFSKDDPRRAACWNALVSWFVPAIVPTIAVASGGYFGLMGLLAAWEGNRISREQTDVIAADVQSDLRMRLIDILYQHDEPRSADELERNHPLPSADLGMAAYSHRARAEALKEFVALERRRLREVDKPRIDVTFALLDHVDATGFDLSGVDFEAATMIGVYLTDANLKAANLSRVKLGNSRLIRADLTGADLTGASLIQTNLIGATLEGCKLTNADFSEAVVFDSAQNDQDPSALVGIIKSHGWNVVEIGTAEGGKVMVVEPKVLAQPGAEAMQAVP